MTFHSGRSEGNPRRQHRRNRPAKLEDCPGWPEPHDAQSTCGRWPPNGDAILESPSDTRGNRLPETDDNVGVLKPWNTTVLVGRLGDTEDLQLKNVSGGGC